MITYEELIRMEMTGLYGDAVLREQSELIELYEWYEGKRGGMEDTTGLDYIPTRKQTRFIKKLINETARFLFGKAPEFTVYSSDKDAAGEALRVINETLKRSMFSKSIVSAARDCFIAKRIALKIACDEEGRPKVLFRPSLEFVFETDTDNIDTLNKIIFFHRLNDANEKSEQRIWKQKYELIGGKCVLNEGVYDGRANLVRPIETGKDTGFDFIPAAVILNDGLLCSLKGESDVAELIDLQRVYDDLTSDDIDALKFNMFPQTVAVNASEDSLAKVVIAPGALVDLQAAPETDDAKDPEMYKLESAFNYDARVENTLNRIKSDMHELMSVPDLSSEQLRGYMTSGKTMKALYWQLRTRCEEKFAAWRPALEWMALTVLKLSGFSAPDDLTVTVENIYPLMEDESEEKALDMAAVQAQVMSRAAYMKKWGRDVSDEDAEEELKRIQLEARMIESDYNGDFDAAGEAE